MLKGEQLITTTCHDDRRVCGVADYAIGYFRAASTEQHAILDSITIVIEAMRRYKLEGGRNPTDDTIFFCNSTV